MDKIRVGIIGASPDRGWAVTAHVPALRALSDQYELTAVGTSREESARESARLLGVPHWFTDPAELAGHPAVDLVVVTVKVPHHLELAEAALEAGKHLLVEWPLGRTTEEAEHLASLVQARGVRAVVGLQARSAPAVEQARELIADGYVGRITSVNVLLLRGKGAGDAMSASAVYTLDEHNAAGVLEVSGGHTLDAVEHIVGSRIAEISARTAIQRPTYRIEETGESVTATSPDHIMLHARVGDALLAGHLQDAKLTEGRTRLEIGGTEGDLVVETFGAASWAGIQMSELRVLGSRGVNGRFEELPTPSRFFGVPSDVPAISVRNVAEAYARFADDLRTGSRTVPDFTDAIGTHRLLDALRG